MDDATWYQLAIIGGCATVAVLCTICTAIITPKRTYYPLLKIIFTLTAAIYSATAAGVWFATAPNPYVRLGTTGTAVVLLVISTSFIIRRNSMPQWVSMDWKGATNGTLTTDELGHSVLVALALIRHGAASPELVGQMRTALDDWERQERWKGVALPGQLAAFRAQQRTARQGQNAANAVAETELGTRAPRKDAVAGVEDAEARRVAALADAERGGHDD